MSHKLYPIRYKIPYLKNKQHRLLLKSFLPPGCKRATREVIDIAFRRMQTVLTGGRQPVIRRSL